MNFKETFLKLTQWTIPHGYEETIAHLLPKGCQKDAEGNYFITIGNSETLFTCHLDTVSTRAKVNHIVIGSVIKTDGKTILGGDNKAGVCILMYLIEQGVPGTYYFFVGEECGTIGSRWALKNNQEYFKKFKRAVAFDRRNEGSIITYQRGSRSASDEFADALSIEMSKYGMDFKNDPHGVYTDTAVFVAVIPECTNLSAGVHNEHTNAEFVDISYTEKVAKAASKVDWENLPVIREAKEEKLYTYYNDYNNRKFKKFGRGGSGSLGRYPAQSAHSLWSGTSDYNDESSFANDDYYQATGKKGIVRTHFDDEEEEQEPDCEICKGLGFVPCEACDGLGNFECKDCLGTGRTEGSLCKDCHGEGYIGEFLCDNCDGEGTITEECLNCDGEGYVGECAECGGSGDIICKDCKGTGLGGYNYEDDSTKDYSKKSFYSEDPNDYDWSAWKKTEQDDEKERTISNFDSFANRHKKKDSPSFDQIMVVRQPNGLYAMWDDTQVNFIQFNLTDLEAMYSLENIHISDIIIANMIDAGMKDHLNIELANQFKKHNDGLGRWRYCMDMLGSRVGGEDLVIKAKLNANEFTYKKGKKIEKSPNKPTRRSGKKNR